jgi:hypothetical protein
LAREPATTIGSRRLPLRAIIGLAAVAVGLVAFAALQWGASNASFAAALWFEDDALTLPAAVQSRLGGPLSDQEVDRIAAIARAEVDKAFTGLRVRTVNGTDGFWRVAVVRSVPGQGPLPRSGETLLLGPLGGTGAVGVDVVAFNAVRYAPPGATRAIILDAMGRGIGRVAVHELAHQMLGVAVVHDEADDQSYEYPTPARAAQYYGELHWTVAWPVLQRKLGARK